MEKQFPSQERRKERIALLRSLIEHDPGQLTDKVVSVLCLRFGLKPKTIMEYIAVLKGAGIIVEVDSKLYLVAETPGRELKTSPSDELSPQEQTILETDSSVENNDEEKKKDEKNNDKPKKTLRSLFRRG